LGRAKTQAIATIFEAKETVVKLLGRPDCLTGKSRMREQSDEVLRPLIGLRKLRSGQMGTGQQQNQLTLKLMPITQARVRFRELPINVSLMTRKDCIEGSAKTWRWWK